MARREGNGTSRVSTLFDNAYFEHPMGVAEPAAVRLQIGTPQASVQEAALSFIEYAEPDEGRSWSWCSAEVRWRP